MEEMSGKVQKANLSCFVLVHVRVDQRRFAFRGDGDATTLPERTRTLVPAGRWKKGLGRFRKQAHSICFVLVHVRVCQCRFASSEDGDTTTLPGKMRTRLFQQGDGKNVEAALDESSRRVQRRAHRVSLIGVYVGVGQRCRARDVDATTLPGKTNT